MTTAGHNLLRDGAKGAANSKISYAAIGTSSTTPTVNDTRLGAEIFRKKITTYTNGANAGEVIISLYLAPGEAVGVTIAEVGFFGSNATGSANSGVLLARGLYSPTHTKTNLESIVFPLDLTI